MNEKALLAFLVKNRKEKNVRLFFDIETLQYNTTQGEHHPTDYKNVTYSLAISWLDGFVLEEKQVAIFPNFEPFFKLVTKAFTNTKTSVVYRQSPKVELIAHNNNKYDNHFLLDDMLFYYPHTKVENLFLNMANDEGNLLAKKVSSLKWEDKQALFLEKRIKSRVNLDALFFIDSVHYYTTDNYMKTNVSIKTLGTKLLNKGLIKEDQLKTAFDYEIFNKPYDMTPQEARDYALKCFQSLTPDQLTYIRNDVIILGKSVLHYSTIFKGFDYSKITFTSNILEYYNDNDLTSYQLLNRVGRGKEQMKIEYTDYKFANENFYDYLKPFYKGGLNFYNYRYLAKIINEPMFAIDIHSSYPFAMHAFKIPTYITEWQAYDKETTVTVNLSDDTYTLYRITKETFDTHILDYIKSKVVKEMLVKYFNGSDFININSYTFRMLQKIVQLDIKEIPVLSWVEFETEWFGSRDKIEHQYFVKTQGKEKNKLIMTDPYTFIKTDELNTENIFTEEEYNNSKVLLNGLYGIPALRPYFNLFRKVGGNLQNIENGYANNQRNIVFSIFVTSVALHNLLEPFGYLTQDEIDEHYIYSDTDSHYMKKAIQHKIPSHYFDDYALGTWSIDNNHIDKFYVLNHKKYAYEFINKKGEREIVVKAAGIPELDGHGKPTFNTNQSFESFIENEFSNGAVVHNTKSIYNKQGTISIYPSETTLERGKPYNQYATDKDYDRKKKQMFESIRNVYDGDEDDYLYIESDLGAFSLSDVFPMTHEPVKKENLHILKMKQQWLKNVIEKDTI